MIGQMPMVPMIDGGVSTLLLDHFTDSNGTALQSHVMDKGPGWTILSGAWSIQSNAATETANTDPSYATSDAGHADVTITVTATTTNNGKGIGICLRMADVNNGWLADFTNGANFNLFEIVSNVYTARANGTITLNNGTPYTLKVTASGSTITADFNNGAVVISYNSATSNQTTTKYGMKTPKASDATVTFDDFKVTSP